MLLLNKVAIITGSTSGIGESAARVFADHGAKVLVTGRDAKRGEAITAEIRSKGGQALFVEADLSSLASPRLLVDKAVEQWGGIDIVINNAALICHKPNEEVTHVDWDKLFQVNVKSAFFLIQAALPYLKTTRGCVINVSSINGVHNGPDNLVYDTMKAALNHMTSGLALDNRGSGVRFNAIMPAGVHTSLLDKWLYDVTETEEEARRAIAELATNPKVAKPGQIADALLLLASGLSSWINGAVIPLEGGYSLGHP